MEHPRITAIIFDLGGVVLDIDYQRTINAFKALGYEDFDVQYSQMKQSGLFDKLERGEIEPQAFRDALKTVLPHASDEALNAAWNAIILDFPEGRLDYIRKIKAQMPVFLLSNTNAIHLDFYLGVLEKHTGKRSMEDVFTQVYLSHEIGMRKPEPEAFKLILSQHSLTPAQTLFIDDSPQHIEAAGNLGIQTIHLTDIHRLETALAPFLA